MFADLHVHSVYSDGWYTPDELCKRARLRGVSLLSVTDHDTLAGEEDKRAAAEKYGITYLTGWEISAYDKDNKMHILGYGCRLDEGYFSFTAERKRLALLRAEDSVEKLRKSGVDVTMDSVLAHRAAADLPVHTMHVARAVAKALGISDGEAYEGYLAHGKAGHSLLGRPTPKQAIDCIHETGGVACIAHPGRIFLAKEEKEAAIRALAKEGLDGIECAYTTHTQEEEKYFASLARTLKLLVTGGSDTHIEDGTHTIGQPRFSPDGEFLERLKIQEK